MKQQILASVTAGLVSGLIILGVGGRVLMRLLAFTTPENPRFTWFGTVQIIVLGAAWGLLTGPLILVVRSRLGRARLIALVFGLSVFVPAAVPFLLFSGFSGPIVAPASFLWFSAFTLPALFVLHGMAVHTLCCRWRPAT